MAFELEGDLSLERAHTRRWVSIIAVVIPVAAFVLLAAWFIRAFIVPPTVAIHNPAMMADAPPPPPTVPKRAMVEAPKPPIWRGCGCRRLSSLRSKRRPLLHSRCRCLHRLSAAPPSLPSTSPAFADPAPDVSPDPAPIAAPITAPVAAPITAPVVADPGSQSTVVASIAAPVEASITASAEPAELEPSEPIAGPVPLPLAKRHAALRTAVPLPRPKPSERCLEPDLPAFDRHTIN